MTFPRLTLGTFPTPLHPLKRLSNRLGLDVWVKRDDLTGFAMGGNKVREAEFILADAIHQGADVVLTAGTSQSNHARVIATAARQLGIECHLFVSGQTLEQPTGNLLLDYLAEAKVHFVSSLSERRPTMLAFAERLRNEGHEPYVVPIGGADAIGAHGYVTGFEELHEQVRLLSSKPTCLLFASSSGATYAGMLVGKSRTSSEIKLLGIRTDLDPNSEVLICSIANALAERLGMTRRFQPKEVELNSDYAGEGFPMPTENGVQALRQLWQLEGILLEPVYTAKAMAGLIDLAGKGLWRDERVIFLHTGGAPTVFSFAQLLSDSEKS